MHVVTRWDLESQSLFARNPYDPEFCDRITFATSSPPPAYVYRRSSSVSRAKSLHA